MTIDVGPNLLILLQKTFELALMLVAVNLVARLIVWINSEDE